MKKLLAVLMLSFVSLFVLTACAEENNDPLDVMIWDAMQEPGIRQMFDVFTEETGVEVNLQVVTWGDYWTVLQGAAQGGALPDVFWMHSNQFVRFAEAGLLLDLTEKINDSDLVDLNNFYPEIVAIYNLNGQQMAVPKDVDTIAVWYNRAIFDAAGVPHPTDDWTWDDLREKAMQVADPANNIYGFAWAVDNDNAGFNNVILAYDGIIFEPDMSASGFDHPNTIAGMQFVEQMLHDGVNPSLETLAETNAATLFQSGNLAMSTFGSWYLSAFAQNEMLYENAGIVMLPKGPDGIRGSRINGLGWAAAADGDNTYNAWRLIEFLGTERMQRMQADLGVTMSAFQGTSDNWVNAVPRFNLQAHLNMLPYGEMIPTARNQIEINRIREEGLIPVWLGTETMEEALRGIASEVNYILERDQ